jgi:hypothetical protein
MAAKKPENFGWTPIEDTNDAEKTAAFGDNPLKTHRLYGVDEADLQRQIEEFEARLKVANGDEDE